MFDRFDIVEAYYLFFSHYHEGQSSMKYQRLSKMTSYFKPRLNLDYSRLSENGKKIYDSLKSKGR
jgi:hypothetical protein